ncbi:hypothetical protein [Deinococcus hopiensis]|nr:hypothetical protein [Deinococcus hopiensis]
MTLTVLLLALHAAWVATLWRGEDFPAYPHVSACRAHMHPQRPTPAGA